MYNGGNLRLLLKLLKGDNNNTDTNLGGEVQVIFEEIQKTIEAYSLKFFSK